MILTTLRTQIKWILVAFLVAFGLSIPLMYGLGSRDSGSRQHQMRDHPVARIEGRELMLSDLQKAVQGYVERNDVKVASGDMPIVFQQTLDSLATQMALDKAIKERGLEPSVASVDEQLKQLEVQYITKEAFLANLKATGSSVEKIKENIAHELAIRQLLTQVSQAATVSDDQVKNLYQVLVSMKQPLVYRPAGVEGQHAEFKTKEAAEKFIEEIKAGKPWKVAADDQGADTLVTTDGKLSSFVSDQDIADRYGFIGKLADGQMSEPVAIASDDYLVYSRIKVSPAWTMPYDEAQPRIKTLVLQQAQQAEQQKYLASLLKTVKIEILDPSFFPASKDLTPTKPEVSKAEAPAAEAPKTEAPATEAPKTEPPAAKAPKAEASAPEASKTEAPKAEAPAAEAPKTEAPAPAQN